MRFVSEYPNTNGDNWFTYCNNSPVRYVDPSGHSLILSSLLWGDLGIEDMAKCESAMASLFGSWCENKIAQALCSWADNFNLNIMSDEVDLVEWTENNNLRLNLTGVDGSYEIRIDLSGHSAELGPHINYSSDFADHWPIK